MSKKTPLFLIIGLATLLIVLLFLYNGTIDDGDSISHYLYSRWILTFPYLIIDHWNKPLFSFCTLFFSQLGFIGLKIINSFIFLSSVYYSYRLMVKEKIDTAAAILIIVGFMPQYLLASQSGLTEILFSFLLVYSLCLIQQNKLFAASVLISFLPFSRPEGYFFIFIVALYLVFRKLWQYLPLLVLGHMFYSFIGYLFFGEKLTWVFGKNPNAELVMTYGQTGELMHYIKGLLPVIGLPMFILFWIGIVCYIYQYIKLKKRSTIVFLAFLMVFTTIGAHTVFWYLGIFKSFGLLRNLLTIAPLLGIFILIGFNFIIELFAKFKLNSNLTIILISIVIITYTFSNAKYTFQFPNAFKLNKTQILSQKLAVYIEDSFPKRKLIYHYYPYLSVLLDENVFDRSVHQNISIALIEDSIPANTILIWDDWYAMMEGRLDLERLRTDKRLEFKKSFETYDESNKLRSFHVFYKK
jgi:hypothetical protein